MDNEKCAGGEHFLAGLLFLVVFLILAVDSAHATNGYFGNGYSIESKALAGARIS